MSRITPSISPPNVSRPPENFHFVPLQSSFNITAPTKRAHLFNGTGYYIEDEVETGLNDLQTLFLACFATLIPLVVSLLAAFGIRVLWRRYRRRRECKEYDGVLHTEESVESVPQPLHSHLLNSDKKCGDTHLTIDTELCDGPGLISSTQSTRGNNHSSTNGSIITMTLKNNHLIVETEERNDIEEDSRETKMKYSPSARDGVFVVEVQQGVRRSPGSGGTVVCTEIERSVSISDQCALIHNPPDRYTDDDAIEEGDENDYYVETTSPKNAETPTTTKKSNTGLSQSNQSLSVYTYTYGNQTEYENGAYGYPLYNGCSNDKPAAAQKITNVDSKPKITSAIFKNRGNQSVSLDVLQDGPLLTDLLAQTKSSSKDDDDSIQEEQNRLGNYLPNESEDLKSVLQSKLVNGSSNFDKIDNMTTSTDPAKSKSNGVESKSKS